MINPQMLKLKSYIVILCSVFLVACGGTYATKPEAEVPASSTASSKSRVTKAAKPSANTNAGGYYLDDGPGDNAPADIDSIPDAPLKTEVPMPRANKPYLALGQQYTPMTAYTPYRKQGIASWYGRRYHGKKTSTGEIYDMYAMSGAHTVLPIPSYAKVTNPANGRSVVVRINDRGPFKHDRLIDLSYAAAYKLRLIGQGSGLVEVETIDTSAEALLKLSNPPPVQQAGITPAAPLQENPTMAVQTAPLAPTVSSAPSTTPATSSQYYVQVGAFKSESNGDLLQKKILGLQLAENVGVANVYNNNLYRVKLGPYTSKREADASAGNIRKQLNIPAIVQNQ